MDTSGNPIIAGYYNDATGKAHGTVYYQGVYQVYDWPQASATMFLGYAGRDTNMTGVAVGAYWDSNGVAHGIECFMIDLGEVSPWFEYDYPNSTQTQIHGVGGAVLVGNYMDTSNHLHGFTNDLHGAGWATFDYPQSIRTSINGISSDASEFVGSFRDTAGVTHGFLDRAGAPSQLDFSDASYTAALAVDGNNVVGMYQHSDGLYHGFLWNSATNVWTPLDYPGASQTYVFGICGNDIVGSYQDTAGVNHGFLYVTPEPTTLLLLAMGGLLIAWRRRA
jgi:hypothetical protein